MTYSFDASTVEAIAARRVVVTRSWTQRFPLKCCSITDQCQMSFSRT